MGSRYADLVTSIIGGSYYGSRGVVIPYRYGPTEIRLESDSPNTEFGLYVNEIFSGTVTSDASGNIVFGRVLPRGEVQFQLLNHVTGYKLNTWVTVREYALWLAAYATVLEDIDDNIQTVRDDMAITSATVGGVEDNFAQYVGFYNDLGMGLSTYRDVLHELRLAFRNWGGQYASFNTAVSTITQVPPLGYSRRMWGPNWVLDRSFINNHRFLSRGHTLENVGGTLTGIDLVSAEPDVIEGSPAGSLAYDNTTNLLLWSPGGIAGQRVLATNGELFLPGPASTIPACLVGDVISPFSVVIGTNDYLYLTIDEAIGGGSITVQLTTGLPTPSAAQVAADVNTALLADTRFGAPYATFASSYTYGANQYLAFTSPVATGSSIRLDNGTQNASPALFGIVKGNISAAIDLMTSVQFVSAEGTIDINGGDATLEYRYDGSANTRELRWNSPGVGVGAWVTLSDPGEYELIDAGGATLTVHAFPDDMEDLAAPWPATDSVTFSLSYQRYSNNIDQTKGLWVNIDTTSLPAAVVSDNIDLVDDATFNYAHPDHWFVDLSAGSPTSTIWESQVLVDREDVYSPSTACGWELATALADMSIYSHVENFPTPNPSLRGSNYPQRSYGGLYDYEGFSVIISCWVKNLLGPATQCRSKISFDGGENYFVGSWVIIPLDTVGYGKPTFIANTFFLDPNIKFNPQFSRDIVVGFDFNCPIPGIDVLVEAPTVDVEYISSRYLGNSTISRDRHHQYFGELSYCWSKDELSLRQKQYLGLQHKTADKTTPMAGVTITAISMDTTAGAGTLEYEYSSLGDTRRLRWSSYGTSWGVGVGWVSITATGSYTLYASDGSYLTTTVTREILPIISGTPPATTRSKTITISDTTTYQGLTREISPAQIALDIFDVTEYSSGDPINLYGCITEADFSAATLSNLEIASADPFAYSYAYPSGLPIEGETLTVDPALYTASLAYECDEDQANAVLCGDGLPIPNTDNTGALNWWFNSSTQIEMTSATYALANTFTIDYNLLYQITTEMMNVNPYEDVYAWWADYTLWDRRDSTEGEYLTTVPVYFSTDTGRAYLDNPSTMDTTVAKLYYQNANEQVEVAKRYWRFISDTIIAADSSQLISGAQFFLTHTEKRTYEVSSLSIGLRAVPSSLDLLGGAVVINSISSADVGTELTIEYERQMGPVHLLRVITADGGIGDQLTIAVSGSYNLFDDSGMFVNVTVDTTAFPSTVGVYSQTALVKNGIKFEYRRGTDYGSCTLATWNEIEKNEAIGSIDNSGTLYPIHQLRLTLGGIRDERDFRVRALVLKGLKLHGGSPYVPGITNTWL